MPLIPFKKILKDALRGRYAVGYFEAWNQESLEAVLAAAEETVSPVILGFGGMMAEPEWFNKQGLEYFAALGRVAAKKAKVPVCLILNEVDTLEQCVRGIDLGFNVVMMDTSALPFKDNVEATKKLVDIAHPKGVGVEAELGQLPTGSKTEVSSLTDPEEAVRFVRETGIDALAVSIGNVHLLTEGKAQIDFERLRRIREMTEVPLVIHGGTGFPENAVRRVIELGVCKFNIGTILKQSFLNGLKRGIAKTSEASNVQYTIGSRKNEDIQSEAVMEMVEVVKRYMKLYGCVGKG